MAIRSDCGKWRCQVGPLVSWILLTGFLDGCTSCHSQSKFFHACLHTFLERDFPSIQTYQAPHDFRTRGRILLEGPTLSAICGKIRDLEMCLEDEARICRGMFDMQPSLSLIRSFRVIRNLLCENDMLGLMDFLKYSSCLENFRSQLPQCRDDAVEWPAVWRHIFRLQVGTEVCPALFRQRDCVLDGWDRYQSRCGDEARIFYNRTFSAWTDNWCVGYTNCSSSLLAAPLLLALLAMRTRGGAI